MNLSPLICEAHCKLSDCSVKFLDFVENNPASLKRSPFKELLRNRGFGYFLGQPWPVFINQRTKKEVEKAAVKIYDLITRIPSRIFRLDRQRMSRYYKIPEDLLYLYFTGVNPSYLSSLLSRGDFIFSPSRGLKCIEFNMQANLGGWELDMLEAVYLDNPVIAKFLQEFQVQVSPNTFFPILFNHLIDCAVEHFANNTENEINLAIVLPQMGEQNKIMSDNLGKIYRDTLGQKNTRLKGELVIGDFRSLKVVNDYLYTEGNTRIHIIIEMGAGEVPLPVMGVFQAGNLLIYNGPITRIMSNKLNLAVLSEHEDDPVFTAEERETIKKYIAWTRRVIPGITTYKGEKIKLEEFAVSNREHMVLKFAEGLGGRDVYPGIYTSPAEWVQVLEKALQENNWVLQEYIPSFPYLFQIGENSSAPHQAIWGFFVFGSRYAGGYVRILPLENARGVINTFQGAEKTIILEVKE